MSDRRTIFAKASGEGVAGVAVIRISGPESWDAIVRLTGKDLPTSRRLSRRWLRSTDGTLIDDALIATFEAGSSFTGEQSAEIHCHGGRAVLDSILSELRSFSGCRPALPGEFTRRSFENGRMDLIEVQGLSDLLQAETEYQRRHALRVMSGAISDRTGKWRAALVRARALIEVTIDWADEEVPEDVSPEVITLIENVQAEISADLKAFNRTERLRRGFEVAIVGPPNSGKSSLLNAIAGRDVALVSDIAGTTRDVIEVRCDLGGVLVNFLDTAGIRETEDQVERAGVERAVERARAADLRILLASADTDASSFISSEADDLKVWSKIDLSPGDADFAISTKQGIGISELLGAVESRAKKAAESAGSFGHERQRYVLEAVSRSLSVLVETAAEVDAEVSAEHLRVAIAELDSLTGRRSIEDVLGEVFSTFCVGK